MPNPYVNKVQLADGSTLIDLSSDTLSSANQLLQGVVAHDRTGASVTGTYVPDNAFIVTLTDNPDWDGESDDFLLKDKTFAEIRAAYFAGKTIAVRYGENYAYCQYDFNEQQPIYDYFRAGVRTYSTDFPNGVGVYYFQSTADNEWYWDGFEPLEMTLGIEIEWDDQSSKWVPAGWEYSRIKAAVEGYAFLTASSIYVWDSDLSIVADCYWDYDNEVLVYAVRENDNGLIKEYTYTFGEGDVTTLTGYHEYSTPPSAGTEGTPIATKGTVSNHSVSVTPSVTNVGGVIQGGTHTGTAVTVSASELVSGTYTVDSAGTKDVTNYASASIPSGTEGTPTATKGTVSNHSVSVTPSVTNSAGYISGGTHTGTAVSVSASELVSGTYTASASGTADITNYASLSVPSGTAGTPSATKGTVSNHSVSVTPSVTNTTGWITGSTKTGTAVTVTASELASGNKSITENGTDIDVVGYSTVSVSVSGGGGSSASVDVIEGSTGSASSISYTNLKGEPLAFSIICDYDIATGTPAKIAAVAFDGTDIHAQTITNTSNAQVSYDSTSLSKSYSNGTLTLTSSGASFVTGASYYLTYVYGGGAVDTADVQVGSGATSITFTGLEDEPIYWSLIFKSNFGSSSGYQRVIAVDTDGSTIFGECMDSASHASSTYWTASYSNGSLTITSQGTNAGGYFHQPGYYQLTYAYDASGNYQTKSVTYTPSTSQQTQTITADSQYDALKKVNVTVEAVPTMTLPNSTSASSSGTSKATITPSSSTQYLNIPTGYNGTAQYYTISATSGGSVTVKTTTMSNTSATATQIQFTSLTGEPKAFFCRCTSNLSRSSSNRYYYIADIRWDGSSTGGVVGNKYYVYNGQYSNQTSGYSKSYSNGTLTLSTTGSQTASPGSFYNGTYELVYIY